MITTPRTEEKIFTTSDVDKCINMYLSKALLRTWDEDFIDEDSGEIVHIERNEKIAEQGDKVDNDLIPIIRFHMASYDIKEITVSNQKRKGMHINTRTTPWLVSANIENKTRKILVHAISA
nr:RNA polymerase subunit sigma [Bacteroidales bacterium]